MKDVKNDYTIDIICPLYNAEKYIVSLQKSIENQNEYNNIKNIRYIITKGKDRTEDLVKKLQNKKVVYKIIETNEFSHSLTREKEAKESSADIIVFITQDVKIEKDDWLEKLIQPIVNNEVDATYGRQICTDKKSIEYYTRQKNYPEESRVKSNRDVEQLGINTFFYSDASSAIRRETFETINRYDGKDFPTNEDMYIAYKLIKNGYKIKYCADSEVIHSHNFSFKETFMRYKAYGEFLKMEPEINESSNKAGKKLAEFIISNAIKDKNWSVILNFFPNMAARFTGMKFGNTSIRLLKNFINVLISIIILVLNVIIYYKVSNIVSSIVLGIGGVYIFKRYKDIFKYYTNIPGLFSLIWFLTIGLATLRLHPKQVIWSANTWIALVGAYIFFILGYMVYMYLKKEKYDNKEKAISKNRFGMFYYIMSSIPIIAFLIEFYLNKGEIPLLSRDMSAYQQFGKGIIHYFTVSSCLILPISYIYMHFYKTDTKEKIIIFLLSLINLIIPVLIVSRQLIIVSIVLFAFTLCNMNKKLEKIIIVCSVIFILVGWSVVGLFRNQNEEYLKNALKMGDTNIPVSTMQIYMYVAMNYDNFDYCVKNYNEYKYGINSVYPIFGLIRVKKYMPQKLFETECPRIIDVYTTYPIVNTPYTDGGIIAILIYMFVIGILCAFAENIKKNKPFNILFLNIIKVCITFSFFSAWFSRQVWWFYIILFFAVCKIVVGQGELVKKKGEE